jgi:acyl-CoA reductase-like NAD-dependent aldehyde dehydrogenase
VAAKVDERADELATIDSYEMGGPIALTRWTLDDVIKVFRHYAGWPTKL